jgi:hypothetical protein
MTTQGQQLANEPFENEILRGIGNLQKEVMGFKRLVLTELMNIKQMLTTLTDILLPQTPQETTPPGKGATVMELMTGEDSPSARVPAGAALLEESAHNDHAVHHQPVSPADQEPSDDPQRVPGSVNKDTSTRFGT